jgi:hypothetical protein
MKHAPSRGGRLPPSRLAWLRTPNGAPAGMGAGLPDFVVVNLDDLEKHFEANGEVCLEQIKSKVRP